MIAPITDPLPPENEAPPITAAAIAFNSYPVAAVGCATANLP